MGVRVSIVSYCMLYKVLKEANLANINTVLFPFCIATYIVVREGESNVEKHNSASYGLRMRKKNTF